MSREGRNANGNNSRQLALKAAGCRLLKGDPLTALGFPVDGDFKFCVH